MLTPARSRPIFRIGLASAVAFALSCSPSGNDEPAETTLAETPRLYPQHPVPAELTADRDRIQRFFKRGLVTESTRLNRRLLEQLVEAWGEESVKLVPYHYNYGLCLKSAGAIDLALSETEKGLEKWPRSFHHQTLRAILLMSQSVEREGIVDGTLEAVEGVVAPERHALLEAIGISAADVHVQWANVLFRDGQIEKSLAALERATASAPNSRSARSLRCECLIGISRFADAISTLEELVDEQPELRLESMLAHAYARTGKFAKAWKLVEPLRDRVKAGEATPGRKEKIERSLAIDGATALNGLERHAQARDFLLPWLLEAPEDREGLDELVAALRGMGRSTAAGVLQLRLEELHAYHHESSQAKSAKNAHRATRSDYHRSRGALEIDRLDLAIDASRTAIKTSPRMPELYLVEVEAYARLGRLKGVGSQLNQVMRLTKSPIVGLCLARILVRLDNKVAAESIVVGVENNLPTDPIRRAAIRAHALWTRLALGQSEHVATAMSGRKSSEMARAAPDFVLLCRAEAALGSGDPDAARSTVSQNFRSLIGGESQARALRTVLDALQREKPGDSVDTSDLVDQEEMAARLLSMPIVAKSTEAKRTVESALDIVARRRKILERMGDFSDSDVLPLWHEMHALYMSGGAHRKARGLAWFLWGRDRHGLESNLRLAASLSRPREVLSRLAALLRAEKKAPDDPRVTEGLKTARSLLGISP